MRRSLFFWSWAICWAGAEPVVEAPFDFLHNQIVLRTMIDGQGPYNFVLDTGTHASTIDLRLARRLRLTLSPVRREATGAGHGRAAARETVCRKLRIGDLTAENLHAAALDLSKVSQELGRPLHGVLGYGFLEGRVVQIDYFRRRIRFYTASPFSPPPRPPDGPRRVVFPMRFRAGSILPVLEDCTVNGTRIPLTLDTGSSLGLILFPQAVRSLGLEDLARQGIPLQAAGYRGVARLTKGWVRSLVLKSLDLGAIEVAYVEEGYGESESLERRGGNLGNAVLQDFLLTLDYRNAVVVLEIPEQ